MDSLILDANEEGLSILSTCFGDDPTIYYVVGTAYVFEKEEEPSKGRILVIQFHDGHAELIAEKEVKGAVFTLNEMQVPGRCIFVVQALDSLSEGQSLCLLGCYRKGCWLAWALRFISWSGEHGKTRKGSWL